MSSTKLSRRSLMRAASLIPVQAVRGAAANSAVSVGLIGAGGRGVLDASLLVKHTSARLTAICDVVEPKMDKAKAAIGAPGARNYRDMRDLLASGVDAVIIATPVYLHPEHLEAAIKAGKHIYIEKPAGADIEGCKRVMRAADAADRKINITFGFQQRYGPGYKKAYQIVSSGGIGKVRHAESHWIKGAVGSGDLEQLPKPGTPREKLDQWKHWRETSGDYIVETYCHGVDVLNWFLGGHPLKASGAAARTVIQRGDQHDNCTVIFTYPGGIQATLLGSQITPAFYRDVRELFYGRDGVIETARTHWKHHRSRTDVLEEKEPLDITANAMQEFVERIQSGKPENTGVRSAESTLTAIMARTAMDLKREVTWEEIVR